jgi:hypothetical protein
MRYAVFADLSRRLTDTERLSLADALDSSVPDGGCVGPQRDLGDEVYFCVEAISEEEARSQAARYMDIVLSETGLDAEYTLTLQRSNRG